MANPFLKPIQTLIYGGPNGGGFTVTANEAGSAVESFLLQIEPQNGIDVIVGIVVSFFDGTTSVVRGTYESKIVTFEFVEGETLNEFTIFTQEGLSGVSTPSVVGMTVVTTSGKSYSAGITSASAASAANSGTAGSFQVIELPVRGHGLYGICGRSGSIIDAFGLVIDTAIIATTLSDVQYDLPTTPIVGTPTAVGQVLLSNNTSQSQTSTAVVDYALEHSSSWNINAGASIGITVGTEFKVKAGFPFVVGGEATATASVTVTGTFSYTYGQVNTERKGFQARVQADVAAGETVIATLTTNSAMLDGIPFTANAMVVYADGTQSAPLPITGEFTGVSQYSLSVDYENTSS